jgi:hypothetical protein
VRKQQVFCSGAFHLDVGRRVLLRDGEIVPLTPKLYPSTADRPPPIDTVGALLIILSDQVEY